MPLLLSKASARQCVHHQPEAEHVGLLPEAANAVRLLEVQGVLQMPVDGLRVDAASAEAVEDRP
jgi:hypothetical protein